ncbi:simple sugar transport system permease protein [Thermocatellispora tengchongensis]|uniref:Simple sugar transport system permease protein n=1 Tax=Thermocatellispora tengchongensis TaxID=1073253 RepID=A0A840PMY4_9ACTN|nr:ABC transporter permease [Thermocatellispora tengchongensis]MBB5138397.1 simple sugar transport system permease protein [Thermocatellispora tengchongensis]
MSILEFSFLAAVLTATAPVVPAALGGLICQAAGVFNIALEGQLLWGAFTAVVCGHLTGSAWAGVLGAVLATVLYAGLLSLASVTFRADPIVVAVGTNLLALGLTAFLMRRIWGSGGTYSSPDLAGLPTLAELGLDVPVLGPQSPLVPLAAALVVAAAWWLARTRSGLRVRGVGGHREAAEALGLRAGAYRHGVTLAAGALCGLGGAQLALGNVTLFSEGMSAGRGWIAVVAVMLGGARPYRVLLACLLFGVAEAVGFRLQGAGLPQQAADAAPYVITLLALVLVAAAARRRPKETTT